MKYGQAFDQNKDTRAEAFRLFTLTVTLYQGTRTFSGPAKQLSLFFLDSLPVMLHYLRPAVEGGESNMAFVDNYAMGLFDVAAEYYGKKVIWTPGQSPIPEALFLRRRSSRKERKEQHDDDNPFVLLEHEIREKCAHCRAHLPEGKKLCCVECKAAYYCNRDCQVAHWKAGHKKDCVKRLKKKLRAEGKLSNRRNFNNK